MVNIRKLEAELWESADLLRAGSKLTSNQYCMPVLGLIFLRYAYSRFKMVETEILKDRPVRGGRVLPVEASDFASKSALFLPREAQYEYLVNLPADIASAGLANQSGHIMNSLGEVVNNAMELVEAQSEQLTGVLPKDYTIFSDELLAELLRIFNNSALDEVGGDVIGRIYEYFLNKFAKNIAQDDGVFFTPKSLVKMIVNVLEPSGGILLDPACGSGGMFVQTGDFVNHAGMNANSTMTFYGQEKVEYNAQLCLMNMAVHGLAGVIKSGDEANTFYHDAHNLNGCCDYVMANPPFNVDKVNAESTQSAGRLPFGMPSVNAKKEVGNGNYLWISYFHSYLNEHGRAGFVMASSATDSSGKDRDIRQKLVETGHVDVMVSVGNNFFYTKSLPCSLWFFDKGKREELQDKVLFIDARNYYTFLDGYGFSLQTLINAKDFEKLALLQTAADAVSATIEEKKTFQTYAAELIRLMKYTNHEDIEPDIRKRYEAIAAIYGELKKKRRTVTNVDLMVEINHIISEYVQIEQATDGITLSRQFDISKIDFDLLRREFAKAKKKNLIMKDLQELIRVRLDAMLFNNPDRIKYHERYQEIIEDYNSQQDRANIEKTFDELMDLVQNMDQEERRYVREGFSSDEELSLYDMLFSENLSKQDIQKIKKVAVDLLQKVKSKIAELDHWTDKQETKATIDTLIRDTLWLELPECYDELRISEYRQRIYEYVYTRYKGVA